MRVLLQETAPFGYNAYIIFHGQDDPKESWTAAAKYVLAARYSSTKGFQLVERKERTTQQTRSENEEPEYNKELSEGIENRTNWLPPVVST